MEIDSKRFEQAKNVAGDLMASQAMRMQEAAEYREMYELKSSIEPEIKNLGNHVSTIVDPSPRTRLQGAKRLLTSTELGFIIPRESEQPSELIDRMEKASKNMWWRSGMAAGIPLEEDGVTSSLIYDEVHVYLHNTAAMLNNYNQMVERLKKENKNYKEPPAIKERIQQLVYASPIIFEIGNPEGGYPEWDMFGLSRFLSRKKVKAQYVENTYGIIVSDKWQEVHLMDLWELDYRHIWVEEEDNRCIVQSEHELPFIPIDCWLVEGSRTFWSKPDEQRQPFLYTTKKAKLHDFGTLNLSAMATNVKTHGLVANFFYEGDDDPKYKQTGFMGVYKITPGEKLTPIEMPVNGRLIQDFMARVDDLLTQATIYPQSLGEPGGKSDPFSKTALLHQAGRLPLVTVQRQMENAASSAMWKAWRWIKHDNLTKFTAAGKQNMVTFNFEKDELPEHFIVQAKLKIDVPTDKLQMATMAAQLAQLTGKRYVIENVLDEAQAQEIMNEASADKIFETRLEMKIREIVMEQQMKEQQQSQAAQMQQQAMLQQQQAAQDMAGAQAPQGGPQGIPPEIMSAMALQQQSGGSQAPPPIPPMYSQGEEEAQPPPPMEEQ